MTWGVNLLSNDSCNAVAMAQAIVEAFAPGHGPADAAGIILDAIEIGNEADLYANHGFRPANWSVKAYVDQSVIFVPHCTF